MSEDGNLSTSSGIINIQNGGELNFRGQIDNNGTINIFSGGKFDAYILRNSGTVNLFNGGTINGDLLWSPVTYIPHIAGSESLNGTAGSMSDVTIPATLENVDFAGGDILFTAILKKSGGGGVIQGISATATASGTGIPASTTVYFTFSAAQLNTLAPGTYLVYASSEANNLNDSVHEIIIGSIGVNAVPESEPVDPNPNKVPNTGDSNALWIALSGMLLAGLAVMLLKKKQDKV